MKKETTFVRMFKPQFAGIVERGEKLQTVRPTPKRRPAAGDTISLRCWIGLPYRSKQRVLKVATITQVMDVEIYGDSIHVGNRRLSAEQREAFAKDDGFHDFAELSEWFRSTHDLPFHGILISWENATSPSVDAKEK
jgi:hypothetical protein